MWQKLASRYRIALGPMGLSRSSKFLLTSAFSRTDTSERPNFRLYLDEFRAVSRKSIAEMLGEVRKFNLGLLMAHQYMSQLEPAIRMRDASPATS